MWWWHTASSGVGGSFTQQKGIDLLQTRERGEKRERRAGGVGCRKTHTQKDRERSESIFRQVTRAQAQHQSKAAATEVACCLYFNIYPRIFLFPLPPPFLNIYRVVGIVSSANERKSREADFLSFLFPSRKSNQTRHTQHTHTTHRQQQQNIRERGYGYSPVGIKIY